MRAVELGVTVKDFVLGQLRPALFSTREDREEFRKLAAAWEKRREEFTLNRGDKTWREIIHEGHKW
jgi:hypothetical protein